MAKGGAVVSAAVYTRLCCNVPALIPGKVIYYKVNNNLGSVVVEMNGDRGPMRAWQVAVFVGSTPTAGGNACYRASTSMELSQTWAWLQSEQ